MFWGLSEGEKKALKYVGENLAVDAGEIYDASGLTRDEMSQNGLIKRLTWKRCIVKWGSSYYITDKGKKLLEKF